MNQIIISHPALVALQGRIKGIAEVAKTIGAANGSKAAAIRKEAQAAIGEIDQWLTDPAKQTKADPVMRCSRCGTTQQDSYCIDGSTDHTPVLS